MDWLNQLVCIEGRPSQLAKNEIVIVPDGDVAASGADDFKIDEDIADVAIAEFEDRGNDLPIDFEHSSVFKAANGEAAPAVGWIEGMRYEKGVGIVAAVKWSEQASKHIAKQEYKYLSPVLNFDDDRKLTMITSVALTNQPRIKNMRELLAASEAARAIQKESDMPKKKNDCSLTIKADRKRLQKTFSILVAAEVLPGVEVEEEVLPDEQVAELEEVGAAIVELKEALGDEATDESAAAVVKMAVAVVGDGGGDESGGDDEVAATLSEIAVKLGLDKAAKAKEIAKKIDAMHIDTVKSETFSAVKTELDELKKWRSDLEASKLVGDAVEAGKLNPHDEDQMSWARELASSNAEGFNSLVGNAPPLYFTERLVGPDGKATNSRSTLIASMSKTWDSDPSLSKMADKKFYVDQELRDAGYTTLSDGEAKRLADKE